MTGWITATLLLLCASQAQAHFKLLKPASWLNEDDLGGPQKGAPCGPGNTRIILGDDVQPVPISGARTSFQAGETITVDMLETIYHPGYWRISIAETRPAEATTAHFPDPALTDTENCYYDRAAVKTAPHDNVLADGLFMAEEISAEGRTLTTQVKLPDEGCEHCTLQIVQVMEGHPASSCFYYHCAEIEVLAADGGTTTPPAASADEGGCSVRSAGARNSSAAAWWWLAIAWMFRRRGRTAC